MNPSAELEAAVSEIVRVASAKPNNAHTFSMILARIERWPGITREAALEIARKNFPGSYNAWHQENDARARRLQRAVRLGGRIN